MYNLSCREMKMTSSRYKHFISHICLNLLITTSSSNSIEPPL